MTDIVAEDAPKRLLIINPNTNSQVTGLIRDVATQLRIPGIDVDVVNPDEGPFSIEQTADRQYAEPKVIEMVRAYGPASSDGIVLACFDDIGVSQARRISPGPVLDACEAGIMAARCLAERFSIITTVESAVERIEQLVARYGASNLCTVHATGIGVADAASGSGEEKLGAAISEAVGKDGAKAVVLGSGGLTGRAGDLSKRFNVPVIDGVAAAITTCQSILHLGVGPTVSARFPRERLA